MVRYGFNLYMMMPSVEALRGVVEQVLVELKYKLKEIENYDLIKVAVENIEEDLRKNGLKKSSCLRFRTRK